MAATPLSPSATASALAIVNARVFTGDPRRPWVDALLVLDGRIAVMGSSAEIAKRLPRDTRVIDARCLTLARAPMDSAPDAAPQPLGAGAPATFVVVRGDLARITARTLAASEVVLEVVDGRIVHDPGGLAC